MRGTPQNTHNKGGTSLELPLFIRDFQSGAGYLLPGLHPWTPLAENPALLATGLMILASSGPQILGGIRWLHRGRPNGFSEPRAGGSKNPPLEVLRTRPQRF